METTIKIGRREISRDLFAQAVATNNNLTNIIKAIGLNPIPATTRANVINAINSLGLKTQHIKHLTRSLSQDTIEKRIKTYNLSEINQQYFDAFLPSIAEQSRPNYKCSCGNFLESIGQIDFATVTPGMIIAFANKKKTQNMQRNTIAYIRSMMVYVVANNICNAKDKVSKDMLLWLISK